MSGMMRSTPGRSSPRERHAEIDREPGALARVAEAIERRGSCRSRRRRRAARTRVPVRRAIIAYLPRPRAGSPRRAEDTRRRPRSLRACRRAGAACSRPVSSSVSKRPRQLAGRGSRTAMSPPMPAARASQSARIAAKPAPRSHCARRARHARREQRANSSRASPRAPRPRGRSPDRPCRPDGARN